MNCQRIIIYLCILFGIMLLTGCDTEDGKSVNYVNKRTFSDGYIDGCTGKLAYQKWMMDDQADATLLFLAGRAGYTDKYHHVVEAVNQNWNIVMFDFFGQGRTVIANEGQVPAHTDDFDTQHVCDTKKVIDELVPEGSTLIIAAHSMGAFIATRLAQTYPDIAKAYVFSSPMYGINLGGFTVEQAKKIAKTYVEDGRGTEPTEEFTENPPCEENAVTNDCEMYNKFKDDEFTLIGSATFGWVYAALLGFEQLFEELGNFTKPVLMFKAGDEQIVIPAEQDRFCDSLDECRFITYPNNKHENFNEINREVVFNEMEAFFLKHLQ